MVYNKVLDTKHWSTVANACEIDEIDWFRETEDEFCQDY